MHDKLNQPDIAPAPASPITTPNRTDPLFKILTRFDSISATTNQKATATIAYNTIVIGGIILKYKDILDLYAKHPLAANFASFLLALIALLSLASLWLTFSMILPYLRSPRRVGVYHSAVFYGDIAEHETAEAYLNAVHALSDADLERDLAFQAHAIASGLQHKFRCMRLGILLILAVQLPALAVLLVIKLCITS